MLVSNPFEAIKVRLQLQGACSDAWSLLGELGLQGLYRGWQGCAARDVTFSALTFPVYGFAKEALAAMDVAGPGALLVCGVLAASPAAFFATPGDVISTRQKQGCGLLLREEGGDEATEDLCALPCDVDAIAEGDEPWE